MEHGYWSAPEYDCSGPVKKWLVKYSAPFFGWDALRSKLEFKVRGARNGNFFC